MTRRQLLLCWFMLAAGLSLALCSAAHRIAADRDYTNVMVLVDWHALNSLPDPKKAGYGYPGSHEPDEKIQIEKWELFAAIPGAQLCYGEETVGTLLAQGIIRPAPKTTGTQAFEVLNGFHERSLLLGLERHGYVNYKSALLDGHLVFEVPNLPQDDLALLPIAWLDSVIANVKKQKVDLILRPGGSEFQGGNGITETLEFCTDQALMLFQGPTVLGYPNQLKLVSQQLEKNGQAFAWVEFDEQDGGATLASQLAPNVVRVHSIPPEEMVNYDAQSAVARYIRAVKERSIRCIYVRPFIRGKVLSSANPGGYRKRLEQVNQFYFKSISDGLKENGFTISQNAGTPTDIPSWLELARKPFFVLAKGAVFIMLLALWFPAWPRVVWRGLLALVAVKAVAVVFLPQLMVFFLLEAAIIFPLWGFWLALLSYRKITTKLKCHANCPRRIFVAMLSLLIASAVTIVGGLLIHGAMWDENTILKIGQFRGVTLALALPVLLFAAYAWQAETLQDAYDEASLKLVGYWQRFMLLWQSPIRYGDVAFILIAVGVLGLVLLRSGNDSPLAVLSVESWFRGSLEEFFSIRPRTKELFGHPLMVVFLMSMVWRTRISLLFGIAALLAQASILNTFCHLHTPLAITIERVLLGLGLGLVSALVWGMVITLGGWLWLKLKAKLV